MPGNFQHGLWSLKEVCDMLIQVEICLAPTSRSRWDPLNSGCVSVPVSGKGKTRVQIAPKSSLSRPPQPQPELAAPSRLSVRQFISIQWVTERVCRVHWQWMAFGHNWCLTQHTHSSTARYVCEHQGGEGPTCLLLTGAWQTEQWWWPPDIPFRVPFASRLQRRSSCGHLPLLWKRTRSCCQPRLSCVSVLRSER